MKAMKTYRMTVFGYTTFCSAIQATQENIPAFKKLLGGDPVEENDTVTGIRIPLFPFPLHIDMGSWLLVDRDGKRVVSDEYMSTYCAQLDDFKEKPEPTEFEKLRENLLAELLESVTHQDGFISWEKAHELEDKILIESMKEIQRLLPRSPIGALKIADEALKIYDGFDYEKTYSY